MAGRARLSPGRRSRNQTERASRKDSRQKNWRQKNGEKTSSRSQSNFWSRQVKFFPFFCLQFFCLKSSAPYPPSPVTREAFRVLKPSTIKSFRRNWCPTPQPGAHNSSHHQHGEGAQSEGHRLR